MQQIDESWNKIAGHVAEIVTDQLRADPPVLSPWFAPDDAATYLGLSVRGLEDMRAKSTGPRFHKVGARVVRYHCDDLDGWLRSNGEEHG